MKLWPACLFLVFQTTLPTLAQQTSIGSSESQPTAKLEKKDAVKLNEKKELFFPIEKNNVQIFPQRFEYNLINKDQLQIGNVLVDSNEIEFKVISSSQSKTRKIQFRWPASLLSSGEIALKDNSGKAFYFKAIDTKKIRIQKNENSKSGNSQLATFETTDEVEGVLREIRKYPFFKFCIHREQPLTKIYLCSKDLFIKATGDAIEILSRDSYRPESFVEINGRSVGDQGLIFLNSPEEFVSMKALLLSGASLEVDTRMKTVDFKDVHISPDGQQLIVRAKGAEPIDSSLIKSKASGEWEVNLDVERPYTYLKGEGDLPLRQEFLIKGSIRNESVKVTVTSSAPETTNQKQVSLTLKTDPNVQLGSTDKKTSVKKLKGEEYQWLLKDLQLNQVNRRYLSVQSGKDQFIAAYDIERIPAYDANLRLMYPFWLQGNFTWLINRTWDFNFQYDNQIVKKTDESDLSIITVGANFRTPPGIHLRDNGFMVGPFLQQFQNSTKSLALAGVNLGGEYKTPDHLQNLFQWMQFRIKLPLLGTDSDFKLKTSYDIEVGIKRMFEETKYGELGIKTETYKLESDTAEISSNKTFIYTGIGYVF